MAGSGIKSDVIPTKNHAINILFCYALFIFSACTLLIELFFSVSSGFNRLKETEIRIMADVTLDYYKKYSREMYSKYNSVDFEVVHQDWLNYLPAIGSLILDVGAGSGRDALWLAKKGFDVKAIEPVFEFMEQFKRNNSDTNFEWVIDALPTLDKLKKYKKKVDLILLSAVWMHLNKEQREKSFQTFSQLNKLSGLLVMSLRYGSSPDQRVMLPVSIEEIKNLAEVNNYNILEVIRSSDQLNRAEVTWETVILAKE